MLRDRKREDSERGRNVGSKRDRSICFNRHISHTSLYLEVVPVPSNVTFASLKCKDPRIEYERIHCADSVTSTLMFATTRRWLAPLLPTSPRLEQLLGRLVELPRLLRIRIRCWGSSWYRARISQRFSHSRWPNVGAFGCIWYSSPRLFSLVPRFAPLVFVVLCVSLTE